MTVVGEFLGAITHVDNPGYDVVAVRTKNGAALMALLKQQTASLTVGEQIRVAAAAGEWQATTVTPSRNGGVPPEQHQERGRGGR
jgi:hypothetical protein